MSDLHDLGPQPIDGLMTRLGLSNADLVRASTLQLSFKVVQKARKGRRLTPNAQKKVLQAIRAVRPEQVFVIGDLFNY
ncbi:MAG: hypothetical protein HQL18_01635 [Candidatus Omnitrophica bacterium]|nr:hypothetical protein [Candidatus Omnitrophota bacterium]